MAVKREKVQTHCVHLPSLANHVTKEFKGKMLKWCGACPKWGDHENEMHQAMIATARSQEEMKQAQKESNTTPTNGGASGSTFAGLLSHF